MAPVRNHLPPKPPAVPFPKVNFADLHRGIGIPIPAGYRPPSPPPSSPLLSSPSLPTSTPRGPHQTSVSALYPSPPDDQSERRRRLDQHRGRREMREKERTARHQPVSPVSGPRRKSGLHRRSGSSPCPAPRRKRASRTAFSSEAARLVHGYFEKCLDDGVTVLTREEQDFLVGYLEVDEDGRREREFVRRLVRQLDWSECGAALTYKLAAWIHFHDGCDQTVVRLLTQRLSRPDAVDRMRSIEKEEELVMCRTIIGISQKRLEKSRR